MNIINFGSLPLKNSDHSLSKRYQAIKVLLLIFCISGLAIVAGCSAPSGANHPISAVETANSSSLYEVEAVMDSADSVSAPQKSSMLMPRRPSPQPRQPTLGTQWGEGLSSASYSVDVKRVNPTRPDQVASIAYQDANTVHLPLSRSQLTLPLLAGEVEWSVIDESGKPLALYKNHQNRYVLAGREGQRYSLKFTSLSRKSYDIVATVDGLDVISGKAGSYRNGGYLLYPGKSLVIDGFRKSKSEVAAFRFAKPDRAYAANTPAGDSRNIGVIGAAIFTLKTDKAMVPQQQPNPFPVDSGYAPRPLY